MDVVDGIDCTLRKRRRVEMSNPNTCLTNGGDVPDEGVTNNGRLPEEMFDISDVESQIVGTNGSSLPTGTEIRVKHPLSDDVRGDTLGGYLVTTENNGVYYHRFQSLSQTGLLYTVFKIRDGDFLMKLNGEDTGGLQNDHVIKMFENLKLDTNQSMETWTPVTETDDDTVAIEFTLRGYETINTSNVSVPKLKASNRKRPLLIQIKGQCWYLKVDSSSKTLTFDDTTSICNEGHICHFFQERIPGTRQCKLKSEAVNEYVGFAKSKCNRDVIEPSLLRTVGERFHTAFDFVYDRDNECWEICFRHDDSKIYYLQMDLNTKLLEAMPSHKVAIDFFPAKCSNM